MKTTITLQFESNTSAQVARLAGQAADRLIKQLQVAASTLRNGRYVMSRENLLRGPLGDEYRRASWF